MRLLRDFIKYAGRRKTGHRDSVRPWGLIAAPCRRLQPMAPVTSSPCDITIRMNQAPERSVPFQCFSKRRPGFSQVSNLCSVRSESGIKQHLFNCWAWVARKSPVPDCSTVWAQKSGLLRNLNLARLGKVRYFSYTWVRPQTLLSKHWNEVLSLGVLFLLVVAISRVWANQRPSSILSRRLIQMPIVLSWYLGVLKWVVQFPEEISSWFMLKLKSSARFLLQAIACLKGQNLE